MNQMIFKKVNYQKKLEIKKNENIYQILIDSLAHSIWDNEYIKKNLLLQLFGGINKD